jgi:hypothetical protein
MRVNVKVDRSILARDPIDGCALAT